jgi:hypothetical protein
VSSFSNRLVRMMSAGCAAVSLVVPASAAANIVLNKSIDGVTIGASMATARHILGKPNYDYSCTGASPGPCGPGNFEPGSKPGAERFWQYNRRQLDVFFWHGKVQALTTTLRSERTTRGIGPGVNVAHMKQAYRKGAVAPFSGAQGWWLPDRPKKGVLFTVFVGTPRNNPTKLGGTVEIVEVGRWLGDRYSCDFWNC